ncbi:MAG: hypothetical protein VX693_01185 [Pseudomonadota bacterium]|nr:hypothetical protein [Pseudomonadota bacterium]
MIAEFDEILVREGEIRSLQQVLNNAVSQKRWLVAVFIRLFFSKLINLAVEVRREKWEVDKNKLALKETIEENPFVYRMR